MKRRWMALAGLVFLLPLRAQQAGDDLRLEPQDLRIDQSLEGGYDLWIRRKPGASSVLLTESSADPAKRSHSYALRNPVYHPVNGDERRILDGKFIESKSLFFLVDSTPEPHPELGEAFHLFIPYVVEYGYPWSRTGEIQVLDGTFLNVRSFARPYADYSGPYLDNPFRMSVEQVVIKRPEAAGPFMKQAVDSFSGIAEKGGGKAVRSVGKEDLVGVLEGLLAEAGGDTLDLALALDTTQSMEDEMPVLKKEIVPMLARQTARFKSFRVGLLLYRDYFEEYVVKPLPFADNLKAIQARLDAIRVAGGRDLPEAVFEALYTALDAYNWQAKDRLLILIGDAPPHPRPRGKVTAEMVYAGAERRGIKIHTIILPQ